MSELLIQAAKNGYYERTLTLIEARNSVDLCDENNATALYWGACRGHSQICEVLIQAGSNLNAQVTWGSTPLHAACDRGHVDCVQLLINYGANVNIQNRRGDTPLHVSAYRGFINIVQLLIAVKADLYLQNDKNKMACEEADASGHINTVSLLTRHMIAERENSSERRLMNNSNDSGIICNGGQWILDSQQPSYTTALPHGQINESGKLKSSRFSHDDHEQYMSDYVRYNTNMTGFHNNLYTNGCRNRPEPQENVDDGYDECDNTTENIYANNRHSQNISVANGNAEQGQQLSAVNGFGIHENGGLNEKQSPGISARQIVPSSVKETNLSKDGEKIEQGLKSHKPVYIDTVLRQTTSTESAAHYASKQPVSNGTNDVQHRYSRASVNCIRNADYEADKRQQEAIEKFAESLQMEIVNQREQLDNVEKQKAEIENRCSDLKRQCEEMKLALSKKEMENTKLKIIYHNERRHILEGELGMRGTQTVSKCSGLTSVSNSSIFFTHQILFKFLQDISLDGCVWTNNDRAMLRLKEMLHAQFLKRGLAPPLDVANREWILGKDYNIIGDQPINQVSDNERNGACSLIFRISHKAKHYVLKMMINMINLHATEHGDGHSMHSYLVRNFSPEYDIPCQLLGHCNLIKVRHHYSGATEKFVQFRKLIIPDSFDVPIDMASRTTFLVTEEYPSTLMAFMENQRMLLLEPNFGLNDMFLLHLVYQLLSVVYFLQKNAVVHRDIKADNIFLDEKLRPVLGDFGMARKLHGNDGKPLSFFKPCEAFAGNSHAWAPELSRLNQDNTKSTSQNTKTLEDVYSKTDAYAVSRMMYSLLRSANSPDDFPQSSVNRPDYNDSEIPELPSILPVGLRCILQSLVRNNPIDRISARKAMLSTGMMLFAPSQGEVMSMTDATSYCQSRMLKLLTMDKKNGCSGLKGFRQITMDESVQVVGPELEADFLYNITPEEFWEIYQSMAQRHLLSI